MDMVTLKYMDALKDMTTLKYMDTLKDMATLRYHSARVCVCFTGHFGFLGQSDDSRIWLLMLTLVSLLSQCSHEFNTAKDTEQAKVR